MEGFNFSTILWLVAVIAVYLFGIWEGRGKGYKQRKVEEEQEKKEKPAPKPVTVKVDEPGLLRIKNEDGIMTLDLDGQRVQPTALTVDQRKRLIEMLNIMRPWLEGKPASVPAPTTPPPSKPMPASDIRQSVSTPNAPPPLQPATSQSKTGPIGKKKDDEPEIVPTSIVGQINMVLQHRIADTPLASRGVTLMESLSGGVNVYVGVKRYEMIDDVPDEEIRAAIRAAIAEWENKYTPGMS